MTLQHSIEEFAENVRQDVLALAESDEQDVMLSDLFAQTAFEMLSEAGHSDDPLACYHRARGMEVSGYGVDEDESRLDLFLCIHTNSSPPETVTRQQVDVAFRRLRSFLEWCLSGRYVELEESSPVFDMADHIHAFRASLTKVRLCVITDGRTTVERMPEDELLGDIAITSSLWDIVNLHRLSTSGREREALSVDLVERFGEALPCLEAGSTQEGYRAFLMLIPGEVLRSIYSDYGARLLETNVRSFLQARGKVNRGIRDTISHEPERFLAYNNGITLTAERVELSQTGKGTSITKLDGLQIVNGGQTTASLLATNRGRADLSQVHVAAKLIEIELGDVHDELVRNVSRYANSQNRVSDVDFSANDPFHIRIEEFSRTTWAPPVGGLQRQTKWFYERARGQYQDAKASQTTQSRRRAFALEHPTKQRFTKTDLAKFENTWDQLPHMVSRGAQKNFTDYMIRLGERGQTVVDRIHFERLVAKAILFLATERIVQRQNFGGYRANIVAYTLALLSNATSQRLNLDRIWKEQALTENLQEVIANLSHEVHRVITNPPTARNITEWCKSERCWEVVRDSASRAPVERLTDELLDATGTRREQRRSIEAIPTDDVENFKRVIGVNPEGWEMLATWGAETRAIDVSQRQLALRVGKALHRGNSISPGEAARAVEILERAAAVGFAVEAEGVEQPALVQGTEDKQDMGEDG
ncbi:MAG: AIPR family protein [Chloroflexi bacterium]|nr:AIPR family protein [Chloroflexota bacterium]